MKLSGRETHFTDNRVLNQILNLLDSHPYWSLIVCSVIYYVISIIKDVLIQKKTNLDYEETSFEVDENRYFWGIISWVGNFFRLAIPSLILMALLSFSWFLYRADWEVSAVNLSQEKTLTEMFIVAIRIGVFVPICYIALGDAFLRKLGVKSDNRFQSGWADPTGIYGELQDSSIFGKLTFAILFMFPMALLIIAILYLSDQTHYLNQILQF
jgi:hypothetical protein